MSGIFGIVSKDGQPIKRNWITSMLDNLRHRGTDGENTWWDESIVLGHLMLQTTPESRFDKQPLSYEHWVITADVRLDNRKELFNLLNIPSSAQNDITDSLLIVKSFEKWGKRCPEYLVGDFAFVIWDKVQRSLFCAKDHAGVRQLFYYETPQYFVFATEVRAIAKLELVPNEINEDTLKLHLLRIFGEPENLSDTFIKGIKRLMPACWLFWHNQKTITTRYWERNPENKIKFADQEEYGIALRELIQQAIDDRMRTDHAVGVTLSGGLDSSSIACLSARRLAESGKKLYSASSVLPLNHAGIEEDERGYIEMVLAQEKNIVPQFVSAQSEGAFDGLNAIFENTYEPVNSFFYMDRAINESFAPKTRIILSGLVGDSTVSNYGKMVLAELFSNFRIKTGVNLIRQKVALAQQSYLKIVLSEVIAPLLPTTLLIHLLNLKKNPNRKPFRLIDCAANAQFISEKLAIELYNQDAKRQMSKHNHHFSIWDTSTLWFKSEEALNAHYGKEYTFPFADKRIIEFLWALPPEYFFYKGVNRGILRRAMEGVLPEKILWRRDKNPYSPDFQTRMVKEVVELSKILKAEFNSDISYYLNLENILDRLEKMRPARNWRDVDRSSISVVHRGIQLLLYLKWLKKQ